MLFRNREYPRDYSTFFSSYSSPPVQQNTTDQSLAGLGEMAQAISYHYPISASSNFSTQIYATQMFQSDFYRAQLAFYRRGSGQPQRTLGSLYWMLNDIWAAPTKASVEANGRWKMLHYGARDIYNSVIIAPYLDESSGMVDCWATSDLWSGANGTWSIKWYDWQGNSLGEGAEDHKGNVNIGAINSTQLLSFNSTALPFNESNAVAFLTIDVVANGISYSHANRFSPISLSQLASVPNPNLVLTYSGSTFTVESQTVAAYVWLELPDDINGYFSDNGFWMLPGKKQVTFTVTDGVADNNWAEGVTVKSLYTLTI